jgi:hypothetical protein
MEPFRDIPCFAALVRHAGIVDVVEETAFDRDVAGVVPELDRIAETDAALPVPDGAADETEIAIANDDPAGMGFLVAIRRWFAVMPERRKLVPAYSLNPSKKSPELVICESSVPDNVAHRCRVHWVVAWDREHSRPS